MISFPFYSLAHLLALNVVERVLYDGVIGRVISGFLENGHQVRDDFERSRFEAALGRAEKRLGCTATLLTLIRRHTCSANIQ